MFLKSTIVSECLPVWAGAWFPNHTFLLVRNTLDNATSSMGVIRTFWERNSLLRAMFQDVVPNLREVTWTNHQACLTRSANLPQSTYEAAGVGTTITGRHYTDIICDDLISAKENTETGDLYEPTREDINAANSWLDKMPPLHQDPATGWFFNTTTRWCDDDTIAYTAKWPLTHMAIDSIDESGPEPRPVYDRFSLATLERLRVVMGDYLFNALMRNRPLSASSRVFRREDIQYMPVEFGGPPAEGGMHFVIAVDPAGTKSKESDFFALVVVGIDLKDNWFVVDYINERIGGNLREQANVIAQKAQHWNATDIVVETNFWQGQLEATLKQVFEERTFYATVHSVRGTAAMRKDDRIMWLQPLFQAHRVFLKRNQPELEQQLLGFRPSSSTLKHDDLIDALGWVKVAAFTPSPQPEARKPVRFSSNEFVQLEIAKIRGRNSGASSEFYAVTGARPSQDALPVPDSIG
jgi:phage terminase large subunit-like protein